VGKEGQVTQFYSYFQVLSEASSGPNFTVVVYTLLVSNIYREFQSKICKHEINYLR